MVQTQSWILWYDHIFLYIFIYIFCFTFSKSRDNGNSKTYRQWMCLLIVQPFYSTVFIFLFVKTCLNNKQLSINVWKWNSQPYGFIEALWPPGDDIAAETTTKNVIFHVTFVRWFPNSFEPWHIFKKCLTTRQQTNVTKCFEK